MAGWHDLQARGLVTGITIVTVLGDITGMVDVFYLDIFGIVCYFLVVIESGSE